MLRLLAWLPCACSVQLMECMFMLAESGRLLREEPPSGKQPRNQGSLPGSAGGQPSHADLLSGPGRARPASHRPTQRTCLVWPRACLAVLQAHVAPQIMPVNDGAAGRCISRWQADWPGFHRLSFTTHSSGLSQSVHKFLLVAAAVSSQLQQAIR